MALTANTSPHSFPAIFGYHLVEQLYLGSRTAVYRSVQLVTQRPVVIKVLRRDYPSFGELVQFRNQYAIAKNLPIPGIVQPLSLEPLGNGYGLVMEDCGGVSLGKYIQQQSLDLTEVLVIALQIADTLHDLIHHRVVHKDIKPANILIQPESKQVKLIDFSIASLLPKETQEIQSANILEGTLAYLAPEQTGRMNRGIDYRADFYALGVTLYQLLTGTLPFTSDDPLELMHCHIAKVPVPVEQVNPDVPGMVAAIVTKLMAKNAEDRYQSALGLKHDLKQCLTQWKITGEIAEFELGQRDLSDRFLIPEKLYGRATEVAQLLAAFDRVAAGASELMLVAGFSGIGKTAVVNEVHKPIVRQRGYFIKGKFDQFNHNIPLSAFVQSLRDLMGQLLSESDAQLMQWRTQILTALGENGQVLIEVIPELELIIGQQPIATELSGSAAQNRFNLLFQKFIEVFTTTEHPLVLFLDDLQWADSVSLQLIKLLMSDNGYLLMLGAYRDNEVSPVHPFILTVEEIRKANAIINTITLAPLNLADTNHLVADTLHCFRELAQPLTELIDRKTQGNPFFTTQFLKALHEDGQITFDRDRRYWECNIAQVNALALTDDVVEFMALQLQKLPLETQQVLKLAACVGNQFNLSTLAIISEQSAADAATALWKALQEGLILPTSQIYKFFQDIEQSDQQSSVNPSYRFLHDRVQQAAYSLIPDHQKQLTHLSIGQLLLRDSDRSEREERLFEIVNHLNGGIALITSPHEQQNLAELNLAAGQKAKMATAYAGAISYFATGIELLPADAWESHYPLALVLYEEIAEASYLNTDFEQMEQWVSVVLQKAKTLLDMSKVQQTRILGANSQGKLLDAIQIGLQVLRSLGIEFPEQPTQEDIGQAFGVTRSLWADKPPRSLLDLPTMSNPHLLAAMEMLTALVPAAYVAAPTLMPLLIFKQVELSIQSGNCPVSVFAYGDYGLILCGIIGDIENGYKFGELALSLHDRLQLTSFKCRNWYVVHTYIKHWTITLSEILPGLQEAYHSGLETGDIEIACLSATAYCYYAYYAAQELTELAQTMDAYRQTIHQYKHAASLSYQEIYQQTVLNLLGQSEMPHLLTGAIFNQEKSLAELQAANQRTALFMWHINQAILYYLFGQEREAAQASVQTAQYLDGGLAMFMVPLYSFFDALIQLTQYADESPELCHAILLQVQQHQDKLHHWAALAPSNHQHRCELIAAEQYRVLGNKPDAIEAYDRAISSAKANNFIQDEALANELAAKFYLEWGKEKIAQTYMQEAYYCYARWGAKAKTDDLERRYPQLLKSIREQRRLSFNPLETIATIAHTSNSLSNYYTNSTSISDALDFNSVLKAAQNISSTIKLDKLVTSLTKIILENSGAKKSVLILPQQNGVVPPLIEASSDTWQVKAITFIDEESNSQTDVKTLLDSQLLDTCQSIPIKLINYVKNIQETVIIDNCQTNIPRVIDKYMLQHQPKSVLSTPIINQGHLVGIIYLENQLISGVFTTERLQVINLLASQAAISLENARLYQQAGIALQDLQQAQLQIVQSEKMSALGNLVAGVAHEMNNPLGFIYASLQEAKPTVRDIVEHLRLYQKNFPNPGNEIKDHAEDIDLDYSLSDFPKIIDAMVMSCDRLRNISTSLRTFSRADKDYKIPFNIHEGIDSTILILKHRLKANQQRPEIEVITNYGNLPQIECFPGQLNQVFMNILANAIDALDESNTGRSFKEIKSNPNRITIKTSLENEGVKIAIADNGKGMNELVKQKIFDHLFTTKGVTKGTGLGLAIARQIVTEKHGGTIEVNSRPGEGTEFAIELRI
ncbi:ATP-binding sensor histidine kinase [Nostoc sp.]|uniref:ATP-binding sensor histidine kinase n=1 Tax=Nostoc sp. TaxID=1180 RepID=UPI002FFA50C8